MKTLIQLLVVFIITSCNPTYDKYDVLTDENYRFELNAYAPYDNFTRKGYALNKNIPYDNTMPSDIKSYVGDKKKGVEVPINMNGSWEVVKCYKYLIDYNNNNKIESNDYNGLKLLFKKDSVSNSNGKFYKWYESDKGRLDSKFGSIIIKYSNTPGSSTKVFSIIDVSEDFNYIVIQTNNIYLNQDTNSSQYSFERFIIKRQ